MSTLYAIVPAKDPLHAKSRLASLMSAPERLRFSRALALRTLQCCASVFGAARTVLVTPADCLLEEGWQLGVEVVREPPQAGLNPALRLAAAHASRMGADGVFIVPTDIAHLSEEAMRSALEKLPPAPGCVIVGNREHNGTNVLGIRPVIPDLFAFGESSYARHIQRAEQLGYAVREHRDPALAWDIDYPEDYRSWRRQGCAAGTPSCPGRGAG